MAGNLEICETPGHLESLVRGTRVQVLGSMLRKFLPTGQGEDLSVGGVKHDACQVPGETPSADVPKREEQAEGSTHTIQLSSNDNRSICC